ncbi:GMC oxidoreductase domain-containing protein [Phthorimaea operculella]|nr:GMC oxidoreductase domain-containing protein [Phthorimaea operculella]
MNPYDPINPFKPMNPYDPVNLYGPMNPYDPMSHSPDEGTFNTALDLYARDQAVTTQCGPVCDALKPNSFTDNEEFEYVVVGAGAAGCAVAARLASAGYNVLLLEAGLKPSTLTWIPMASQVLLGSTMDWQYQTIPNNKSCLSSEGEQCRFSRGKTLGGSTAINYMMYTRGNREDYNYNIPGWTWDDMEPYFMKYEGLRDLDKYPPSSRRYHNTHGTMDIGYCNDPENDLQDNIVEGLESLGFPFNEDCNGKSQIGVTRVVTYTANGERESTMRGYLDDVKDVLKVSIETQVTGVLFDENNVANGVSVVHNLTGKHFNVRASRGVVLSAGTIGTPQLLMLSGIGPAEHLEEHDIPVRVDLPVGENMKDHVLPTVFIQVKSKLLKDYIDLSASAVRYGVNRHGPLGSIGLTDTTAFANTLCYDFDARKLNKTDPECEFPTLQLINAYVPRGAIPLAAPVFQRSTLFNDNVIDQISKVSAEYGIIVVNPIVLAPKSHGWVRLNSADPLDSPAIYPNYLDEDDDVEEMLRSITILEHLVETPAYQDVGAKIVHLSLPGCPEYDASNSEAYWECYVRHLTFSVYHATGTCSLGSVLDADMAVRGVQGLHVADLSALPRIPRGNTAAAAIALGERLSDILINKKSNRQHGHHDIDRRAQDYSYED